MTRGRPRGAPGYPKDEDAAGVHRTLSEANQARTPAWRYLRDSAERIRVQFERFALPGGGQLPRMQQLIVQAEPDAETKDQYFILADGSGARWQAHRYACRRRR